MNADVSSKGFRALLVTQLFGALNDNLFKVFISLLAIDLSLRNPDISKSYFILTGVCFVIPYLIFAPLSGTCSDKFSKTKVIQIAKFFELLIFIAMYFFLHQEYFPGLLIGLFLLGMHSAFYSPSKYGILPEMLKSEYLSRGNGLLEMAVFLGSISGTGLAGIVMSVSGYSYTILSFLLLTFAVIGFIASFYINPTQAADPGIKLEFNPFKTLSIIQKIKQEKALFLILFSSAYFWGLAAFYQQNIQLFAKELSKLNDIYTSILLTALGLGIGVGSMFAGKVSKGRAELGLVPIGAMGIAASSILLSFSYNYYFLSLFFILTLGISSGFFIVPQNAFFQEHSKKEVRGSFLAASNFLAYFFMLLAYGLLSFSIEVLKFDAADQQVVVGIFTAIITVIACRLLPSVMLRAMNWILIHSLYRVRIEGANNIPENGGALIICNHVAYTDPPIIMASCKRLVRFLIYKPIYETPIVHQIAKHCRAIPIDENDTPKQIVKSINEAREALKNGELVCIFAEGGLSRIGHLLGFKKGFERIIRGLDVPIIPMYIDQIWGSIFSNRNGRFFWKLPKQLPYPITVRFGPGLPHSTKASEVRQVILELIADVHKQRKEKYQTLYQSAISSMKKRVFAIAAMDSSGKRISNFKLAVAAISLANKINKKYSGEKYFAILLPPSIAGLLSNLALSMSNSIPVNLNYTAGDDAINKAIGQCDIKTILTSRLFLEKQPLKTSANFIFIEDMVKEISLTDKILATFKFILPSKYLFAKAKDKNNLATIIFSSGSTAEPKGVMLTQANIKANIESIYELFNLRPGDSLLGVLPFFHSFGFTATLWLPLLCSMKAVYHHNPFDAAKVGELIS
nr:MFS transporter [Pseudomonadota bacterium]